MMMPVLADRLRPKIALLFLVWAAITSYPAAGQQRNESQAEGRQDELRGGVLPVDEKGNPLNFDFETGTLADWQAEGEAFAGQPVKGDTVHARRQDMKSEHAGRFWIGTYEGGGDGPQGTLTSRPFTVTHPYASFLVAGGPHARTCVELVLDENGQVIFRASGDETENLKPVAVDLGKHRGRQVLIRLVDGESGHWGHVNFDDFRFHDAAPEVPPRKGPPPADFYLHAGIDPQQAAEAMTVPDGFKVTLFAGEPDVQQPIAMALDDRGRLWIAEAYSYPVHVPEDEACDRILIFDDADGDGRFDSRKVFIDKLNLVSGLEVGFGGVWVGAAPHLLFIPDRDGDDLPDSQPQVLLDGWGYEDTHETLNAFIWGPDGWLYGCHGVFTHSRVGKPGTPDEARVPINAGIWRYHPTRHEFEVFAHGTSNPWGVDFNDQGQAFLTACVIPHLFHVIQGARYQRQAGQHFHPYTYDDIQTIAVHRHWLGATPHSGNNRSDAAGGGHAHSGAMIYLGGAWPDEYRNQIFMNNIHGARLNMDLLSPRGSGWVGNRAPDFLLANDSWSQILNMRYGPDGQVYMIDWYDANQCHHREPDGHDRRNGRIFKVSYTGAQPARVDLQALSDHELVELQLHDNDWYVRHARHILHERGPNESVHQELARMAFEHPDETRRLRGLWALNVAGGLTESRVAEGLANDSAWVRAWTIQLGMERGDPSPSTLARFTELAQFDPSPAVRLYLASALGRLPLDARWPILEKLLGHSEDSGDHNLPLMYWYAAEPLVDHNPQRALRLAQNAGVELVDRYLVRRLASLEQPAAMELLMARLLDTDAAAEQRAILAEINVALAGRRQAEMPPDWQKVYRRALAAGDKQLESQATTLGVTFGDKAALHSMEQVVADDAAGLELRQEALAALVKVRDPVLPPILHGLVDDASLRRPALRALGAFDHAKTPQVVLDLYPRLSLEEKRDALAALTSRIEYARALLAAVADERVPAADLSAELVRQLRNLGDDEIGTRITGIWGTVNETPEERRQAIAQYKRMLTSQPDQQPDLPLGRAVFAKSCHQCHRLFGTGGEVGPELTGSNRADLDYLLSNVLDPSALIGKDYQAVVVQTVDGRLLTGLVRGENDDAVTLVTATETVVLPHDEIEVREPGSHSMMPDDLLKPLSEHEVRSLVAYLASTSQVPMLATADNVAGLFDGRDLTGWQGDAGLWTVEEGQIVGRTAGLDHNEFLVSDLAADDFRLSLEVLLVDNQGNSGVQFRSTALPEGEVQGYQADVGPGWWGKLYEEHGRGLIWPQSGEQHVRPGDWNHYEIVSRGSRLRTWINGQLCVDLDDPAGARRGIFAVQLHSGGLTEVRFRDLRLELTDSQEPQAGK